MQIVKLNFIVSALFASGNTTFRSPFFAFDIKKNAIVLDIYQFREMDIVLQNTVEYICTGTVFKSM